MALTLATTDESTLSNCKKGAAYCSRIWIFHVYSRFHPMSVGWNGGINSEVSYLYHGAVWYNSVPLLNELWTVRISVIYFTLYCRQKDWSRCFKIKSFKFIQSWRGTGSSAEMPSITLLGVMITLLWLKYWRFTCYVTPRVEHFLTEFIVNISIITLKI